MSDLHPIDWQIPEITWLIAAAHDLIEQQAATIAHLEDQLVITRANAVRQLWDLRNISCYIVNTWVEWRKPIGSLATRDESRAEAMAQWHENHARWYAIDDLILGKDPT